MQLHTGASALYARTVELHDASCILRQACEQPQESKFEFAIDSRGSETISFELET